MTPGKRLRDYIERNRAGGETWEEFAQSVGVTKTAVFAWFAGTNEPDAESLRRLAVRLGVTRATIVAVMDGERQ